jgi:hypothetical protein
MIWLPGWKDDERPSGLIRASRLALALGRHEKIGSVENFFIFRLQSHERASIPPTTERGAAGSLTRASERAADAPHLVE